MASKQTEQKIVSKQAEQKIVSKQTEQNDVGKLIAKYQPQIKSYIRKRVANKEDAEDILQDVFYQFIKAVETTLNPIEHVSAWLYRVAHNIIINKGIKKKEVALPTYSNDEGDSDIIQDFSEVLFHENASLSTPETEYLRSLVWVEFENALAELPAEQREIFELTEMEGLPVKDISETTGIAVNTLLSRKHYAVLHLRKRLSGLYQDLLEA
jgi:RNA polymerase sigma factor (sigma-70 family)